MSSEMDPKFWEMISTVVAEKLADHDTNVSSKRYDQLFCKLGDNTLEINKVKADIDERQDERQDERCGRILPFLAP